LEDRALTECLACGESNFLVNVLDLGLQPLANSYLTAIDDDAPSSYLNVKHCKKCTHSQLESAVDPTKLYSDYKYVSGTTQTLKEHFKDLVTYVSGTLRNDQYQVLDIGCNDGSLLQQFLRRGFAVQGVDPAENLRSLSKEKGINVLVDFWSSKTAEIFTHRFDAITILNCLAHNGDPYDFLKGCTKVLRNDGIIVIEFPYFGSTLDKMDLGQFYAEHHSYFSLRSFKALIERLNLHVVDTRYFDDIHGGTYRFVLKKINMHHCADFYRAAKEENVSEKLFKFKENLNAQIDHLTETIRLAYTKGYGIVAYGASAKSSTLFNLPRFIESDALSCVKYVVDDNPLKQGLYCPGSMLRIKAPTDFRFLKEDKLLLLMTVHNFKEEIRKRLKDLGIKGQFLNYTPEVTVETI
jgi:2-polyprenyl-3-methyl-5-hydroxy-6-metoxy-1,4-benzoquinol methylase